MDGPTIPQQMRQPICEQMLTAQKACLDVFDAAETGDLVAAVVAMRRAMDAIGDANEALRVLASLELANIQRTTGLTFGRTS